MKPFKSEKVVFVTTLAFKVPFFLYFFLYLLRKLSCRSTEFLFSCTPPLPLLFQALRSTSFSLPLHLCFICHGPAHPSCDPSCPNQRSLFLSITSFAGRTFQLVLIKPLRSLSLRVFPSIFLCYLISAACFLLLYFLVNVQDSDVYVSMDRNIDRQLRTL